MVISGEYPVLTTEDRNNLHFYKVDYEKKARDRRRFNRRFFKQEAGLYAILIAALALSIKIPAFITVGSYIVAVSIAAIGILSIHKKRQYKKSNPATSYVILKCLTAPEYEDNALHLFKIQAQDTKTGYETTFFGDYNDLKKIGIGEEFEAGILPQFLNYVDVETNDTIKDTVLRKIF